MPKSAGHAYTGGLPKRLLSYLGWGMLAALAITGAIVLAKQPWKWETRQFSIERVDGAEIEIGVGCGPDIRAEIISETLELVEIKARFKRPRHENDCLGTVVVGLDAPLGDRTVIDHSTGQPVFDPSADTG